MSRASRAGVVIALLLALPAREARADDPPPEEVRVIGNRPEDLQRIPGSGTIVGAKDIARAAPTEVAEMLRRVPGVQVRQEPGAGGRFDLSIRGVESGRSRRVLVLEDGIPVSLNPYSEPDMYFAPPVERVRAIEVVKGSGNILFGPQTLAGVVNFLTIAPPSHRRVVADVDVGTYGYVRGLASYGDVAGDTRWVVQALHRRGEGFRGLDFAQTNALAKLTMPTGNAGRVTLKLGVHRDESGSDDVGLTAGMYARDPQSKSLSPQSRLVLERYDLSLTHEAELGEQTKLTTLAYAYRTSRIWRRQDYTRVRSPGETYARIVGDTSTPGGAIYFFDRNLVLDRDYDVVGVEPRARHELRTGGVAHTIDFGGRLLHESADYEQRQGGYTETYAGALELAEKHTGNALAGYVQDRIAFRDDLLVTPGIRVEHFAFDRTILRQVVEGQPRDVFLEGGRSVTGVIPGIGTVVGKRRMHVFGGFHVGWAPPRVTAAVNTRGISSDVGGDRSLDYELGTRTQPTRWAKLEATGFLSNFQNQVVAAQASGGEVQLVDAGATTLRGGEGAMVLAFDRMIELPFTLDLGVRYTYSLATFRYGTNAGHRLPYAPEHTASANLDVEHASGIGGQVAWTYVGPQFTDPENTRQEDVTGRVGRIEGRSIVDATAHYRWKRTGLTFRLTAKNLLDATYIAARRPEGIFAGPFRQILLGVRWEWEDAK